MNNVIKRNNYKIYPLLFFALFWSGLAIFAEGKYYQELHQQFLSLSKEGKFQEALDACQKALEAARYTYGDNHATTGTATNNLGEINRFLGRHAVAESLFIGAITILDKGQPPDPVSLVTAVNNLATLYLNQRRYAEAESLYRRSLKIEQDTHGPESGYAANSLDYLMNLFMRMGNYSEAESFARRSLAVREKLDGPNQTDAAGALNNLAETLRAQYKNAEAESLYVRALSINETVWGTEHPSKSRGRW